MTINDFWYADDYKLYNLYEEAYYEKLHEKSHIQGYYNYIAISTCIANILSKDKTKIDYPKENIYQSMKKEKNINNKNKKLTKDEYYFSKLSQCY